MAVVLIVDDSESDRRLVSEFLVNDPELTLRYAEDGRDALDQIENAAPDVVVTDLMMPQMDGLQLVAGVKKGFPSIPVILMTSRGSEEIAVQALQEGAASYVPKRLLGQILLKTVHRVLAVAGQQFNYARLVESMTESEFAFALDNDGTLIPALVTYMQEQITTMRLCDELDRMRVGVALEEALLNALYHGNLEVGSELRESDDDAYQATVEQRRRNVPYCDRRIHVEAGLSREKLVFKIQDEGPGFDPAALPDPTDPANLEKATGRGVLLMRTFMDEVIYNDVGNAVTLTKSCRPVHGPTETKAS